MLRWMAVLAIGLMAAQVSAQEATTLKSDKDKEKSSYAMGVDMARNFRRQGIEVDVDALAKGLKDELSGGKLTMSEEDLRKTLAIFQNELRLKQAELRRKMAQATTMAMEASRKEGDAFLTANRTKEGVVALPSGLQYKVLKAGEGKKPADADTVEVNYRGTLINNTAFDSSYTTGKPATFKVAEVIPGWREALKLMPVGSKWQLFVPSDLAYGVRGGPSIPPNSTLLFEVELLSIKAAEPASRP